MSDNVKVTINQDKINEDEQWGRATAQKKEEKGEKGIYLSSLITDKKELFMEKEISVYFAKC
jgi:hypothetical protein